MDSVRSPFRKMQLWIVEHFFLHKKVPVVMYHNIQFFQICIMIHYYRYLFVKKKVFNYSELHFSEGTFYKIHTLEWSSILSFWFLDTPATPGGVSIVAWNKCWSFRSLWPSWPIAQPHYGWLVPFFKTALFSTIT